MQSSAHLGEASPAHRLGATLEVPDTLGFGSSLSLRSFSRVGFHSVVFLAFSLSVLDCCTARASLATKGWARLGSSMSVADVSQIGSTFVPQVPCALRSVTILLWSRPDGFVAMFFSGSSVSLRSFARSGASLSELEVAHLAATISVSKRILLRIVAVAF